MQHCIQTQQFDPVSLNVLFTLADELRASPKPTLAGKILAALFYEPSTRTRLSFESAMQRLGGTVIGTENAAQFSSAAKGETLEDTMRVVSSYADVVVLRHTEVGAAQRAAAVSTVPVINAGDGAGQHPTQALIDLYTIRRELERTDNFSIVFVGDLVHGRTVHSLAYLLAKYEGVTMHFVSPPLLALGQELRDYLLRHGVVFHEHQTWDSVLDAADVVYQTRVQKERFRADEALPVHTYRLATNEVSRMKEDAIILHPLPRVDEIAPEVDAFPQAAYFRQAANGVPVRMALLKTLLESA